ncbi:hypothetical protein [Flavobacterium qiangtangense]
MANVIDYVITSFLAMTVTEIGPEVYKNAKSFSNSPDGAIV